MIAVPDQGAGKPPGRWQQLAVLSTSVLLVMGTWFSGSSVAPTLAHEWTFDTVGVASMTVAVQLGFAVAAVALAALGAPDVLPARWLIFGGATLAAVANLGVALVASDLASALPFRFLTGAGAAAVYPVAMKVLAGWFRAERGLAVGTLTGAITVGSALPHLLSAGGVLLAANWQALVVAGSAGAAVGASLALLVREGPDAQPSPRFSPALARAALRERSVLLANLGYLGHMWEVFAMWSWIPAFLLASLAASGMTNAALASLSAFAVLASGGIGCVAAGVLADRFGRTTVTIGAMAGSGSCALLIGFLFGGWPVLVLAVAVVWGVTVVADSAQFSTAVTELAPPGTAGSALTLQTALGFTLTAVTIWGIALLEPVDGGGWRLVFAMLALGPAAGIVAMWRLRLRPDARLMAGGRR